VTKPKTLIVAAALAAFAAGCGSTTASSSFKGADHAVAETVGNLQSEATANEDAKICSDLLTKATVEKLGGQSGCEAAVKSQLGQVDSFELATKSVQVNGDSATAQVEAVVSGKKKTQQLLLVKEGSAWKISALG
jgi:copper chaperone CopZ